MLIIALAQDRAANAQPKICFISCLPASGNLCACLRLLSSAQLRLVTCGVDQARAPAENLPKNALPITVAVNLFKNLAFFTTLAN